MLPTPKKSRARKIVAGLSVLGGGFLLLREIPAFQPSSGESWFWIVIALLALVLGIIELLSPAPRI
jgi:hypothetical protein